MAKVLIIDDDRAVLHLVERGLSSPDVEIVTANTAEAGMNLVRTDKPDAVLLDIMLPRQSGLELFQSIHAIDRRLPVIFITSGAGSETAIEAMQLGAYDYVAKPLDLGRLRELVGRALDTRRMMNVPVALPVGDAPQDDGDLFVGRGPQMLEVFKAVGRVAKQNVTVLIRGESGTGKELVARAIYQFSDRADRPFMAVNCAALPESLLEAELFGHEKGSFTGADRRRIGKFEQCSGGTLFLDEVGDMAPMVQAKVLRVIQEQRFERVGGNETIETDVRLIAATNQPLEKMVENGDFRGDLLYRLNGVTIQLPPLRERGEDVPLLLQHYLARFRQELRKFDIEGLSPETLDILKAYRWPGNVRELQSVVRQAVLKASGPVIVPDFLPTEIRDGSAGASPAAELTEAPVRSESIPAPHERHWPPSDLRSFIESRLTQGTSDLYAESLEMLERYLFTRVLQATAGNQSKAAEILGITRGKVRDRIAAFNISVERNVTLDVT